MRNELYYGDNLDVLRRKVAAETVDLCYIDPPFNSKRNYFQIYNNQGSEDRAQAQAFVDTWNWGDEAVEGIDYILHLDRLNGNADQTRWTPQTVALIRGLEQVLGRGSLLAYLVHMTLRIVEIHRVLKPTGSFYLHCDPTASHYLKLVLDAVFCGQGGDFLSEISWKRSSAHNDGKQGAKQPGRIHDVIMLYSKSSDWTWNQVYTPYDEQYLASEYKRRNASGRWYKETDLTAAKPGGDVSYEWRIKQPVGGGWEADLDQEWKSPKDSWTYKSVLPYDGRFWAYSKANLAEFARNGHLIHRSTGMPRLVQFADEMPGVSLQDMWSDIPPISPKAAERLGYPTQKPHYH